MKIMIPKLVKKTAAFTLVELMITIGIISMLFAIVIANASSIRSQSNDARRKADLAQIQSALQNYYADLSYYPKTGGTSGFTLHGSTPTTTFTSQVGLATSPAPSPTPSLKTYLKTVPSDNGDSYCYQPAKTAVSGSVDCDNTAGNYCNFYYLSAHLDNTPGSTPPPNFNCGSGTKNYFVTPN